MAPTIENTLADEKTPLADEKLDSLDTYSMKREGLSETSSFDIPECTPMLSNHESTTFDRRRRLNLRSPTIWYIISSVTYTLLSIATLVALFRVNHTENPKPSGESSLINGRDFCGTDVETALKLGCKFDILGTAWLPPICYDETATQSSSETLRQLAELTEVDLGDLIFYVDENRTQVATMREMQAAALWYAGPNPISTPFWTDTVYHKAHCLHIWELQDRALWKASEGEHDVWLYERAAQWEHSVHCNKVVYHNLWDTPEVDIPVYFGVGNCTLIRE